MDGSCGVDEVRYERLLAHFSSFSILRPNEDEEADISTLCLCVLSPLELGLCCLWWLRPMHSFCRISATAGVTSAGVTLGERVRKKRKRENRDRGVPRCEAKKENKQVKPTKSFNPDRWCNCYGNMLLNRNNLSPRGQNNEKIMCVFDSNLLLIPIIWHLGASRAKHTAMFSLWFPDLTSWLWWSGPTQKVKYKPFSSCSIFTFEKIKARPVGQRSDLWPFGAYRLNPSCGRTLMEDGSRRLVGAKPGKSLSLFKPNFSVLQAPTAANPNPKNERRGNTGDDNRKRSPLPSADNYWENEEERRKPVIEGCWKCLKECRLRSSRDRDGNNVPFRVKRADLIGQTV